MEHWIPCEDITQGYKNKNYSILVLNTPIDFKFNSRVVINLWNNAKVRLTVDGGTKRWLDWIEINKNGFDQIKNPDLITGDMDSLPSDILDKFRKIGTEIVVTPGQDETDYSKSLRELKKYTEKKNIEMDTVYVLADNWGRLDQIMANINTLYKCKKLIGNKRIIHIASNSLIWLLDEGSHTINIPQELRDNQEWCSLLPVGHPCVVTTSGLKWDMEEYMLLFGGLVSTSNTYNGAPEIVVKTNHPVIWSMSLNKLL